MRTMLEFKEILRKVYGKYEVFILPVAKFLLALLTLMMVNSRLGYMEAVDNSGVVLIVSLLCSFLPMGFILIFGALFVLLHLYTLAIEMALVGLAVFLIMGLLFLRFVPKDSLVVLLTTLCFHLNIPYVMPVCMGLVGTPASAVSVGCGVVVHYMINFISNNATVISSIEDSEATVRLRMVIDYLLGNRAMFVVVAAFAITVFVVYIIRRMSIDYNWSIAIIAGAMVDAVVLLIGDLMYDTNVSVVWVLVGTIVAVLIAFVLQFFVFNVDYRRTEKVQFEDDEYYYYVKAVPKMTVATPTKTVKKINSQVRTGSAPRPYGTATGARTLGDDGVRGNAVAGNRTSATRVASAASGRTVTTERTGNPNRSMQHDRLSAGRSVSANRTVTSNYEETADPFLEDLEDV